MPLLLMCGLPSSGKSKRAMSIASYFNNSGRQTVVIDDSIASSFDKNDVYSDAVREKELRGEFLSAVQRKLSKTRVLILDSLNYIKGYRYELYCAAKAAQTTFCLVYCECTPEMATEWNNSKERVDSGQAYSQAVLQNLIERFEAPDSANRWDTPLISVLPDMPEPPFDAIDVALFKSKPAKPNKATLDAPVANTNVCYDIDRVSQEIVNAFASQMKSTDNDVLQLRIASFPSARLQIRCKSEAGLVPSITDADLQRHRREFIALFRTRTQIQTLSDPSKVPQLFVAFLESRLFSPEKKIVEFDLSR